MEFLFPVINLRLRHALPPPHWQISGCATSFCSIFHRDTYGISTSRYNYSILRAKLVFLFNISKLQFSEATSTYA